jgi:hypothetical protein
MQHMRSQNIIRIIPFPSRLELTGIILTEDYVKDINRTMDSCNSTSASDALRKYTIWIQHHPRSSFFERDVLAKDNEMDGSPSDAFSRQDLRELCKLGFIMAKRDTTAEGMFNISHPKVLI